MTDTDLITAFLSGDIHAFNMLVRRWEKPIYNYILRNTGDVEATKDLCQMTFIRVYKQLKKLKEPEKFSSWIYRIATNQCYDEFKRQKRKRNRHIHHIAKDGSRNLMEEIADTKNKTPEIECHNKQVSAILKEALDNLPVEQRIVVIMKQYQGLKFSEIALSLNEPVNTIKSRMYYGLKALRKYLIALNLDKEIIFHEM